MLSEEIGIEILMSILETSKINENHILTSLCEELLDVINEKFEKISCLIEDPLD